MRHPQWIYCMVPEHLHGEINGSLSLAETWQILHIGDDGSEISEDAIDTWVMLDDGQIGLMELDVWDDDKEHWNWWWDDWVWIDVDVDDGLFNSVVSFSSSLSWTILIMIQSKN